MKLQVIEKNNQRLLTTAQLAEVFNTDAKTISNNFTRNKERYIDSKHYVVLQGQELRDFKTNHQIDDRLKHSSNLYLWTEKGAWMHAKSLNTDEAWESYEKLVDEYYKKQEEQRADLSQLSPQLQFMILMEQKHNVLEQKQLKLEANNAELQETVGQLRLVVDNEVWITDHQRAAIQEAVKKRVGQLKGQAIDAHFQGIYGDLNKFFGVPKYDKIKRVDFDQAMDFLTGWYPKKKEQTQ